MDKTFTDRINIDLRKEALPVLRLNEQMQIWLSNIVSSEFGERINKNKSDNKEQELLSFVSKYTQIIKDIIKEVVKDDTCKITVSCLNYSADAPVEEDEDGNQILIDSFGFVEQIFLFSLEYPDCIIECLKIVIDTDIQNFEETETFTSDIYFLPSISQELNECTGE